MKQIFTFLVICFSLLLLTGAANAQQVIGSYPTMDGGLENQSGTLGNTLSTTAWSVSSTSGTQAISATSGRSGPKYLTFGYTGTGTKRLQSATAPTVASTTYTLQFYYKTSGATGPTNMRLAVGTNGTSNNAYVNITLNGTNGVWTKASGQVTSSTTQGTVGWAGIQANGTMGAVSIDFDDFVTYVAGAVDDVAPDAPTSPSTPSISATQLQVSWTAPGTGVDGGGYIVVRGVADPTTAPNVNGIYAVGNEVAAGQVVAYIGTNTAFTDIGLIPETHYYYRIYTVDKAFNYSSSIGIDATTTTPSYAAEPTVQTTGITFSNITSASFDINWTSGDGSNRIVIMRSGSAVTGVPSDGASFTANPAFGTGSTIGAGNYVVYNGTGSSVSVTGLSKAMRYYVAIYEFNGSGGSENYLLTSPATGDQLAPPGEILSTGTGGDWTVTGTWVGGVVPTQNDNVTVVTGATVVVNSSPVYCYNLTVQSGGKLWTNLPQAAGNNRYVRTYGSMVTNDGTMGAPGGGQDVLGFEPYNSVTFGGTGTSDICRIRPGSAVTNITITIDQNLTLTYWGNNNYASGGSGFYALNSGNDDITLVVNAGDTLRCVNNDNITTTSSTSGDGINTNFIINGALLIPGGNLSLRASAGKSCNLTVNGLVLVGNDLYPTGTTGVTSNIVVNAGGELRVSTEAGRIAYFDNPSQIVTGAGTFTLAPLGGINIGATSGLDPVTGPVRTATQSFNASSNYGFVGTSAQVTGSSLPATVRGLTINNAAGVSLTNNLLVDTSLTLSSGTISTGASTLTLAAATAVTRTAGHVVGALKRNVDAAWSGVAKSFDIGDATNFTPISLTFGTVTGAGDITATTTATEHPSLATSIIDGAKSVNRFYTLVNNATTFDTYSADFTFAASDVDGGALPANFIVEKYNGATWTPLTLGTKTATSTQVLGATSFSDFAVGEPITHTITATAGANGAINPSGAVAVAEGSNQTFTFTPDPGYQVDTVLVDGGYVDSTATYTFTNVVVDHTIGVTFKVLPPNQFALGVTIVGNGSVTKIPDQVSYDSGTVVQVTAVPDPGYHFVGWSGDITGMTNPDNITMNASKAITATFAINTYTLSITAANGSVTKVPDQANYDSGSVVQLTAVPDPGYSFTGWSGDLTGVTNPQNLTMDANKSVTATFTPDAYTLTVNAANGSVVKNPDQPTYGYNTPVQLTATADPNYHFVNWSGDLTGSTNPETITMDANKTVTAVFAHDVAIIVSNGTGGGDWSNGATWQGGNVPTPFDSVVILASDSVANVVKDTCAGLYIAGKLALVTDTLRAHFVTVAGSLINYSALSGTDTTSITFLGGSVYQHARDGGSVPRSLNWNAGSTCLVTGVTGTGPSNLNQNFYNLTWDCPGQTTFSINMSWNTRPVTISGTLTVTNTNWNHASLSTPNAGLRMFGGSGSCTINNIVVNGRNAYLSPMGSSYQDTVTVNGNITLSAGGGLSMANNSTALGLWLLKGNFTVLDSAYFGKSNTANASRLVFAGTGTQNYSISPTGYVTYVSAPNFVDTTGATVNLGTSVITGTGSFRIKPGATVLSGHANGLNGNIACTGAGSGGGNEFSTAASYGFNGSVAQVSGTKLPLTVNNLIVDNAAGVTLDTSTVVTGDLSLTNGVLSTLADSVVVNGTVSRANGHVAGNLIRNVAAGSGVASTFDIGDATNYTPVAITFANVSTGGYLKATTTSLEHPQIGSASINPAKSVNRYYSLTNGGIVFDTYDATMNYAAGDVDGGANPNAFLVGKHDGASWSYPAVGTRTATSTQATGLSSFSDFAIGEPTTFTITATAGANGSITPSGPITVALGGSQQFTIAADAGYHIDSVFVDGSFVDSTSSYTFTGVAADHSIHAAFAQNAPDQFSLVVTAVNGSVTKNPDLPSYPANSTVQLTAIPAVGYHFVNWSGDASGSTNPLDVTMDANKNITANFAINTYTLGITAVNGSVTKAPDQPTYDHGTIVQLTAVPAVGYHFVAWSGDATGSANPINVTMDGNKNITATFAINTYTLDITATNGSVTKNPDQVTYDHGTSVQLTAVPAPGYSFVNWSGDATGSTNPLTVTMDGNKNITANFAINAYTLSITAVNGSVTKVPDQATYEHGTVVGLTAVPAVGYHFVDWTGDATGSTNPVNVTMDGNKSVTANFAINQYALNVAVVGTGTVAKSPDQPVYDHGTNVQLTADAGTGYVFSAWSGDATGSTNPLTVTMDAAKNITATFTVDPVYMTEFRTATMSDWATAVDAKGKANLIKCKPLTVDFDFNIIAPDASLGTVSSVKVKLGMASTGVMLNGVDTVATFTGVKEFTYTAAIAGNDTFQVIGKGTKGKAVKAQGTWYATLLSKAKKYNFKVLAYNANIPRLPMPNLVNVLSELGSWPTIGNASGASSVIHPKYKDVQKSLNKKGILHTGTPKCLLEFDNTKLIAKQQKALPPDKHNNSLYAEVLTLALNLKASATGNFPAGLGALVYENEGHVPSATFNGSTLDAILVRANAFLGCAADAATATDFYSVVGTINGAFRDGTIDTASWSCAGVKLTGVKALVDVPFLHAPDGFAVPKVEPVAVVEATPTDYALNQNYPNPFNPTTVISYSLPVGGYVTLKVYNMLGQEIATLLDNVSMDEGEDDVEFDASNQPSGVYFYRLTVNAVDEDGVVLGQAFSKIGKMMLVK